ncbi:hypothetical protein [Cellulomonas fengjieae]|uniref:hypothetical protein n=1 Tax=Cellulomonas fengjieae TaxID=2819978 RepID=UPI001AAEEB74|nr:hypothetical protein [Cellulomonas fengjieae]MBO3102210.1 hypothetical protein [Cellulomonas fengjieae]
MIDGRRSQYDMHRDRARVAIARQKDAAEREREARAVRDAEILAMLATEGASLGSVAADVGLSKSMVAYIDRTARASFQSAEQARAYLAQHSEA